MLQTRHRKSSELAPQMFKKKMSQFRRIVVRTDLFPAQPENYLICYFVLTHRRSISFSKLRVYTEAPKTAISYQEVFDFFRVELTKKRASVGFGVLEEKRQRVSIVGLDI